jgi:hypothetical protein
MAQVEAQLALVRGGEGVRAAAAKEAWVARRGLVTPVAADLAAGVVEEEVARALEGAAERRGIGLSDPSSWVSKCP